MGKTYLPQATGLQLHHALQLNIVFTDISKKMKYGFLVFLVVLLTACLPSLQVQKEFSIIKNAQTGYVVFGEYQTYYERIGRELSPPVLMVHGIGGGSSLFQYRLNVPFFAQQGYKVFAIDLLGFGRSSRPAIRYTQDLHRTQIESFLEDVIKEPAIVVANGLSAAQVIRLSTERPDLIKALVLITPTGYTELARPQNEARIRQFNTLSGVLGDILYSIAIADNWQRFFLLDAYASEESLTPEILDTYDHYLKVENAKWVVLSFITGNLDQDVSQYWPNVTQPTQIVWGQLEGFTNPQEANRFLEARNDVVYAPIEGAKLLPNEDKYEEFNQKVLEFLQSLP
jgi:pimeloyl-ACP methyl ester carboxylesterase